MIRHCPVKFYSGAKRSQVHPDQCGRGAGLAGEIGESGVLGSILV
jgi:hypothetical protein